ncbi:MAG: hypothetical protein H6739_30680 [Alphaproteobacteria bacterium]|nr:hypothetical protein [Alphaproteobacteria bacterium]
MFVQDLFWWRRRPLSEWLEEFTDAFERAPLDTLKPGQRLLMGIARVARGSPPGPLATSEGDAADPVVDGIADAACALLTGAPVVLAPAAADPPAKTTRLLDARLAAAALTGEGVAAAAEARMGHLTVVQQDVGALCLLAELRQPPPPPDADADARLAALATWAGLQVGAVGLAVGVVVASLCARRVGVTPAALLTEGFALLDASSGWRAQREPWVVSEGALSRHLTSSGAPLPEWMWAALVYDLHHQLIAMMGGDTANVRGLWPGRALGRALRGGAVLRFEGVPESPRGARLARAAIAWARQHAPALSVSV